MSNSTIRFIQHLILSIKSGKSVLYGINSWNDPFILSILNRDSNLTNIEYELKILIKKGLCGFPVLKLLENLHLKAKNKLLFEMERHSKKVPFLSLIPLFLFQVPSLILIFLYPMISNFIKELS